MLEFKSDVIKDASSAKISHLFAAVKVLMKRTFFAFSLFLFLLARGKPRMFHVPSRGVSNGIDM